VKEIYIRNGLYKQVEQEKADQEADNLLTNEVFPNYLFKAGEQWTHVDKLGNIWYEDIKTTYSEQMQDELEPIIHPTQFKKVDFINSPPHYKKGDIECIDAIQAMLSSEEYIGYLRGNSLKYRWRFRYKNGIEDLKKAEWYEERLKKELSKLDK